MTISFPTYGSTCSPLDQTLTSTVLTSEVPGSPRFLLLSACQRRVLVRSYILFVTEWLQTPPRGHAVNFRGSAIPPQLACVLGRRQHTAPTESLQHTGAVTASVGRVFEPIKPTSLQNGASVTGSIGKLRCCCSPEPLDGQGLSVMRFKPRSVRSVL